MKRNNKQALSPQQIAQIKEAFERGLKIVPPSKKKEQPMSEAPLFGQVNARQIEAFEDEPFRPWMNEICPPINFEV